jgi:hypothetical protein
MRLLRFVWRSLFFTALSVGLSLLAWWLFRRLAKPTA